MKFQKWKFIYFQLILVTLATAEDRTIKNLLSGRCVTVSSGSKADSADLDIWDCVGVQHQKWNFKRVSPGKYQIIATDSGKCMTIRGGDIKDSARIEQWPCAEGAAYQLWTIAALPGSYVGEVMIKVHSQPNKCLTVSNGMNDRENGVKMDLYECSMHARYQHFVLDPPLSEDREIKNTLSGRCVTVASGSTADNADLDIWDCVGVPHQKWKFRPVASGGYQIIARHTFKCMTVRGGEIKDVNVEHYQCDAEGVAYQTWNPEPVPGASGGEVMIKVQGHPDKCLTVSNGMNDKHNGVKLQLYGCVAGAGYQQFIITPPIKGGAAVVETPPDPCAGKVCDWRQSDLKSCCNGAYCKRNSADYGVCTRTCWTEGSPCNRGDGLPCCEQMSCVDNGKGFKCFRPPPVVEACKAENTGCGISKLATQCCAGSSCKGIAEGGANALCLKGNCIRRGEQCTIGDTTTPCCAFSYCEAYKEYVPVCRPPRPTCGRRWAKIPGCRLGDASNGFACCSGRCLYKGDKQSGIYSDKDYECDCVSINHSCVDDNDCCNSECGPDYLCAK